MPLPLKLEEEEAKKYINSLRGFVSSEILPGRFHRGTQLSLTWPLGHLTEEEIEEILGKQGISANEISKYIGVKNVKEMSRLVTFSTLRSTFVRGGAFMGFISCSNTSVPCYSFYSGILKHPRTKESLLPVHSLLAYEQPEVPYAAVRRVEESGQLLMIDPHFHIDGCIRIGKGGPCYHDDNLDIKGAKTLPTHNYTIYTGDEPKYLILGTKKAGDITVGASRGAHLTSLSSPYVSGKTLFVIPPNHYFHYSHIANIFRWIKPHSMYSTNILIGGWRVFPDPNSWYYSPSKKAFVNERTGEVVPYTRALFDLMEEAKPGKTYDRPLVGFVAGLNPKEKEVQVILHPFSQGLWENFPLVRGMKVSNWPEDNEKRWKLIRKALDEGYHYIYSGEGEKKEVHWSRGTLTLPAPPGVRYSLGERTTVKTPALHLFVESPRQLGRSDWFDRAWRVGERRG